MRTILRLAIPCLTLCIAAARGEWVEYRLGEASSITATLKVLRECTPADEVFLKLDFENRGAAAKVTDAHYRIDNCTVFDPTTGKAVRWQSLASGNTCDLFPEGWRTLPVNPVLPAGAHEIANHPSGYSMALLAMPDKQAWRIEAIAHLELTLEDGSALRTPEAGVPIRFIWRHPDAQGIAAMRNRLKAMLQRPEKELPHCYVLGALLQMPEIASVVTPEQALAAIPIRHQPFEGRAEIVKLINDRWSMHEAVIGFYLAALQKRDREALEDLSCYGRLIWDDRFAEVLVGIVEDGTAPPYIEYALSLLDFHKDTWKPDTPSRLSAALVKAYPDLTLGPDRRQEKGWDHWQYAVTLLAMTRDPARVPLLRPYLDVKAIIHDYKFDARASHRDHVAPLRACDHACNAIVTLLGRPDEALPGPRFFSDEKRSDPAAELAQRDKKIAQLIAELDAHRP